MRYEDQPVCETCQVRYPGAGIRHPPQHERDAWPLIGWGLFVLMLATGNVLDGLVGVALALAVVGVGLLAFAGSILHHELIDRPRVRRSRHLQ